MATNTDIKNALTFQSNAFGIPPKTVGNAQLLRLKEWFEGVYAIDLNGAPATADDISAYIWRHLKSQVANYEKNVAREAIPEPSDLNE